jgi:tetratricopeptide (TPR) repeat protein
MTMLYRGSIIYLLLLCLLFPHDKAFGVNGKVLRSDSVERFFDHIELLRWSSKNEEAIKLVEQFLTSNSYINYVKLRATNELAENWRWEREYDKALSILKTAEKTYDTTEFADKSEWLRLILYKAKCFRAMGLPDSAETNYKLALQLVDEYSYQQHKVHGEIWMDWAHYMNQQIKYQTAIEYNLKALNIKTPLFFTSWRPITGISVILNEGPIAHELPKSCTITTEAALINLH